MPCANRWEPTPQFRDWLLGDFILCKSWVRVGAKQSRTYSCNQVEHNITIVHLIVWKPDCLSIFPFNAFDSILMPSRLLWMLIVGVRVANVSTLLRTSVRSMSQPPRFQLRLCLGVRGHRKHNRLWAVSEVCCPKSLTGTSHLARSPSHSHPIICCMYSIGMRRMSGILMMWCTFVFILYLGLFLKCSAIQGDHPLC